MKVLDFEKKIGIEVFLTNVEGIGGKLRTYPQDFIVKEISISDLIVLYRERIEKNIKVKKLEKIVDVELKNKIQNELKNPYFTNDNEKVKYVSEVINMMKNFLGKLYTTIFW